MSKKRKSGRNRPRTPKVNYLLDIVMPVFGEWSMLERAIESVEAACLGLPGRYRIAVIDNGTPEWKDSAGETVSPRMQSEGVRERLRSMDSFYRLDQNIGYPGACNYGVGKGNSPLVLIWTSDVVMQTGSITEMVRVMDDPEVGVVGAKLLFPVEESPHGPPGMIQHAGVAFDIEGNPFHALIGWPPDHEKVNRQMEVSAVTGALFLTRRSLFEKIGGFSPQYGGGTFEDLHYCFATRFLAEKKVIYCPTAWGYHYVGGSVRKGANTGGFNLGVNNTIFKGAWAAQLAWDEWKYW